MLAAIAEAEEIEVSEEEMVEALAHTAEHERTSRRRSCWSGCGRTAATRWSARTSGPARRSTLVAESAKPIPVEQAEAREKIWTPEKERESRRQPLDAGRLTEPAGHA